MGVPVGWDGDGRGAGLKRFKGLGVTDDDFSGRRSEREEAG
jgi:hypothetical protein